MCTFPIPAWRGLPGQPKIVFSSERGLASTKMFIPCGQCIECRLSRARDWAHRCVHEATLHEDNCFITLTYSDENLIWTDKGPTLYHRDFQLFMKRFRKSHPDLNIRYFMCGEYGDNFDRPHYHACVFGYDFPDRKPWKKSGDFMLYVSEELAELWPSGYHSIGELNFDTACYCARYVMKKVTGDRSNSHYSGRVSEYCNMSRRPGIGRDWYKAYKGDLYNADICVTKSSFISKPPKYYDRLLSEDNPDWYALVKSTRRQNLEDPDWKECQRLSDFNYVKQSKLLRKYEKGLLT